MKFSTIFVLLTYLWFATSATTSAFTPPGTFDEVLAALRKSGYEHAKELLEKTDQFHSNTNRSSKGGCLKTCGVLSLVLGDLASAPGSQPYVQQQSTYWATQQVETLPACRVQPKHKNDVAAALIVTSFFKCPFAIKSGGHASFIGASNIQDGLTIDLGGLKTINVSSDRTTTQIGPGNRWLDVYSALDPLNLTVAGGRAAGVGVGGLTLGGGISFFSGRHGFACDGVKNYEIVLANGEVKNVNPQSYPEIFWALRGGGNNFGIVTRFDLATFNQGQLWGGINTYPTALNASLFEGLHNYAKNAPQDPDAAAIVAFLYSGGQYFAIGIFDYSKPIVNPPILNELVAIESLSSTLRFANLTDFVVELDAGSPNGSRESFTTATFKNSVVILAKILEIFLEEVAGLGNANIHPTLAFQTITKPVISYFSTNGGNALGIEESDGPLILVDLNFVWSSGSDDARVHAVVKSIIDRSVAAAKELHLDYKFIYQNYASVGQEVFAGYGKANHDRLIRISKKYDPEQVFQTLQPGYFKLN